MTAVGLGPATQLSSASRKSLFSSPGKSALALGCLLVFATLALYHPVGHYPFANADDDSYISDNRHVKYGLEWETVTWAFTTFHDANWHPLTWLSHALDCHLYSLDAGKHHQTNVVLHAANVATAVLGAAAAQRATPAAVPWWLRCSRCIPSTSSRWPGSPSARTCSACCSSCSPWGRTDGMPPNLA